MAVVGIDLGTTNTVVAAVRDGRAAALQDRQGRALLPSVVSFPPRGEAKVGHEAKTRRTLDPENTVYSIKRLIGRSWDSQHVGKARARYPFELREGPGKATLVHCHGKDYTLPEISALVLTAAREVGEQRLAQQVSGAVITVPANFNDLQRAATKVAGRLAGLDVLRIINEPTAAALAYGFGKRGRERIAVYDFGGGTFDVTILDLNDDVFEVLSTAGDTFLGGDDLDDEIALRMGEELKRQHNIDMEQDNLVVEQLRCAAEKLKMDLSTRSMGRATISEIGFSAGKPIDFSFTLRRADFEKWAEPYLERTLAVCQEALDIAGVAPRELDQILLVGGSTRIPLVRRRISSFFGKMPQSRINPDEVVAIGAAIQAAALEATDSVLQIPTAPIPSSLRPGKLPGSTKIGLAEPPASSREVQNPADFEASPPKTLSGVGSPPHESEVTFPRSIRGVGGRSPRTLSGLGTPPTQEDEEDEEDAPTGQFPQSAFDDITSVLKRPDLQAKHHDSRVAHAKPESSETPLGTEDGSVTFDLAELEAEAAAAEAASLSPQPTGGQAVPARPGAEWVPPDAPLADPDLPSVVRHRLDQIEEISGLLEMPDDDEASAPEGAEQTEADALEAELPIISPATLVDLPTTKRFASVRPSRAPAPTTEDSPATALPAKPSVGLPRALQPGLPEVSGTQLPMRSPAEATPPRPQKPGPPNLPPPRRAPLAAGPPHRPEAPPDVPAVDQPSEENLWLEESADLESADSYSSADSREQTGILGSFPDEDLRPLLESDPAAADLPPMRSALTSIDESLDELVSPESTSVGARPLIAPPLPAQVAGSPPSSTTAPLLLDVTPLTLGVETVGGFVETMIERNTKIPCDRTHAFTTSSDYQQLVRVRICQGQSRYFGENTTLGEVELRGLKPGLRGSVRIAITFALDESGLLQVSARDQETGHAADAQLRLVGSRTAY